MKGFFCGNMGHIWCLPCMTQPQERAIKYVLSLQDQAAHSVPQMSYTSCVGEDLEVWWKNNLPACFDLVARSLTIYAWSQIWGYSRFQNLSPTHSWGSQHPRDSLEQPWGEFHGWHFPAGGFGAGAKGTLSGLRIRSFQWACTLMWYKQYHSQPIGDGSEQSHFW